MKHGITIPSLCETRWCYRLQVVSAIKQQRSKLIYALSTVIDSAESWDEDTLSLTDNLLSHLSNFKFMFFINCFENILSRAEQLFEILQCKQLDIKFANEKIDNYISYVESCRSDSQFETYLNETISACEEDDVIPRKRARGVEISYKDRYFEIFDIMLMSSRERFPQRGDYIL